MPENDQKYPIPHEKGWQKIGDIAARLVAQSLKCDPGICTTEKPKQTDNQGDDCG